MGVMNMSSGTSTYCIRITLGITFLLLASSSLLGIQWNSPLTISTMTSSSASASLVDTGIYDLLIITPEDFSRLLQPLIAHKNAMGISTKCVTLDEVYDRMFWDGRDNPEKIKYFIKTAYDQWGISYVLLVGDYKTIPVRYVYNADIEGYAEPCFISELYYADLYDAIGEFSTWDSNENGVYGEWLGDRAGDKNIDLYPDVSIGRLACKNAIEVKIMVNKIIEYETTAYDSAWFQTIVVVGGDTYPESLNPLWIGHEGEETNRRVLDNMSGFQL